MRGLPPTDLVLSYLVFQHNAWKHLQCIRSSDRWVWSAVSVLIFSSAHQTGEYDVLSVVLKISELQHKGRSDWLWSSVSTEIFCERRSSISTKDNDPSIRKKISKKIEARERFAASVKTFLLWKLCGDDYRRYDWKDIGSKKSDKWIYDDKDRMEYFLSLPGQKVGCTGARGRCCWSPSRGTSTPGTSRCCSESQRKSKQAFNSHCHENQI